MRKRFGSNATIAIACFCLITATVAIGVARAEELAPSLLVKPADLTPVERDYYDKATDPQVKKNFIITRSYVRLAQKVVAKTMAPEAYPAAKPNGFSVQYLLPDDPHVLNEALGLALAKTWQKCLETKAPGCR
jgi:hypothetical protein